MANSNYSIQKKACKKFFEEELGNISVKEQLIYDITGLNAIEVVAKLKGIVNKQSYQDKTRTFYLGIGPDPKIPNKFQRVFQLIPMPTADQPGSGILSRYRKQGKTYEKLLEDLKGLYSNDARFAKDVQNLFKNNNDAAKFHPATVEVYMLLLFEIARRLVHQKSSTERKLKLDKLPIGSAIARIVKLLEAGECNLEDVFSKGGKFHCFSFEPDERKSAIKEINNAYEEYQARHELSEMFSPVQQEQEQETEGSDESSEQEETENEDNALAIVSTLQKANLNG